MQLEPCSICLYKLKEKEKKKEKKRPFMEDFFVFPSQKLIVCRSMGMFPNAVQGYD